MGKRGYIKKDEELAAALLQIPFEWDDGTVGPVVDHETAKQLTALNVIGLFHRDHYPIRKEEKGPDVFWNLTWRPISKHRIKTAKVDIPQIAKAKRMTPKMEEFRRRLLAKAGQAEETVEPKAAIPEFVKRSKPKRKWANRPMSGGKRSDLKRKMDGSVVRRTA